MRINSVLPGLNFRLDSFDDTVPSGVVYVVKRSGPSVEPCGTPYESVTLYEKMFLIFRD